MKNSNGQINKKDITIAYISFKLPGLTHTFIHREIQALRDLGYRIIIITMYSETDTNLSQSTLLNFKPDFIVYPIGIFQLLNSQFFWLIKSPSKYFINILFAIRTETNNVYKKLKFIYHILVSAKIAMDLKRKEPSINIIHAHFISSPSSLALFTSKLLNIPFSVTAHARDIYIENDEMERKIKEATFVNVISIYNKIQILKKFGLKYKSKLKVARYGINLKNYQTNKKKNHNSPVLLSVSRLVSIKGFKYLILACKILQNKGYNFKCTIYGDGQLRTTLQEQINKLKLDKYVQLKGAISNEKTLQLMEEADIFILPCIIDDKGDRDGIPNVLIEAMALEIPVISTNIIGIPELIENGESGLLVKQKNASDLASAIAKLIDKPDLRNKLGKKAKEKVYKDFDIYKNCQLLSKYFKEAINLINYS